MFLLSALSAESKKETNSLRSLRLSGDYQLSNLLYDTVFKNTCPKLLACTLLAVCLKIILQLY